MSCQPLVLLALALAGCSSPDDEPVSAFGVATQDYAQGLSATGDSGLLSFQLQDGSGADAGRHVLVLTPLMVEHGHGTTPASFRTEPDLHRERRPGRRAPRRRAHPGARQRAPELELGGPHLLRPPLTGAPVFLLALACIDRADDHRELPDTEPGDSETAAVADPLDLGQQVEEQRLAASIEALEGFGTRHTLTDGDDQARAWLRDELEGYGLLVEEDGFVSQDFESANLIARIEGVEEPDVVYLLSAHYDSTSTNWPTDAPGADDNASGVAVVLEAARILADQPLRYSVWLVLTGAEEQGSLGSEHLADWLVAQGVDVRGVMAPDMIAYWPLGDDDAFDILGDDDSAHLAQRMGAIADELGVANKTWIHHDYCYGDDHTRFQEAGIPAISPMDCVEAHNLPSSGEKTPHYHRTSDTLDTLHLGFTTKVAQVMVATLASWGEPTSAH